MYSTQMRQIRFPVVLRSNNETRTRVDGCFTDIPDGSTLYHIPHCKALDSLILCHAARAVGAAHEFDVATSLLVAAAISSFLGLRPETISATSKTQVPHPSPKPPKPPRFRRRVTWFGSYKHTRAIVLTILSCPVGWRCVGRPSAEL